jgi:signal transduction histidine kinase
MTDTKNLSDLKDELTGLLASESTDFQNIVRLAGEIARREPEVVRFTTDAAMVRRLGQELVAKQETALAELVKNAYDADGTFCTVTVITEDESGAMEINDDGHGMSRSDIENGFMRLANDTKMKTPISPKFGRARAGKKGIGRFATERLGKRLTIVTQTELEEHAWKITIDWTAFVQGYDLNLIANTIAETRKERPHGTRLLIEDLNDTWSAVELKRVYRYLSTLLAPVFAEADPSSSQIDKVRSASFQIDPGFVVQITQDSGEGRALETVVNADTEILEQALAIIEADINEEGKATWSLSSTKLGLLDEAQPIGLDRNRPDPLPSARGVRLKAYYYIKSREFLGHSTGFIRDHLDAHGGIRVYRNGYRVPPYGEREDDWLNLDYKRSATFAPINTKAFLGFVALADPEGKMFDETSSREGLVETEAFREVRNIMSAILEAGVRRIESVRGKGRGRKKSVDPSSGQTAAEEAIAAIAEVLKVVERGDGADTVDRERLSDALARLSEAMQVAAEVARERDDLLKELSLLRILASMGLTIAEFTHDFSHLAETMELSVIAIRRAAVTSPEALDSSLARLEGQFGQVRAYTAHFGNMMTSNASRELQEIDLYDFARTFREDMSAMFDRRGLELLVERPVAYDIFTTKMHPSEWSSILLNLLTNAIKATRRAQRAGKFLIRVGTAAPQKVFLEFSDNGDGIPEENRERVFDAFFTTTGGSLAGAPETAQALGTGLGLKIVADIVHSVGGEICVVNPPFNYATCIRITVPAGNPPSNRQGNE